MKKKYLLSSLLMTIFLSSCSYGSVATVSSNQFKEFYNSGDLATQKDHNFAVGENISLLATYEDDNDNYVMETIDFQTSSIGSWESKKLGNRLLFSQIKYAYENEDDDDPVYELYNYGSLNFTSKIVKEELDEEEEEEGVEAEILGKEDSYTFQKTYEMENQDTSEKQKNERSLVELRYYESDNNGKSFSAEPSYQKRTEKNNTYSYCIQESNEKTERDITEITISETIAYTENFETDSTRKILSFSFDMKTITTHEIKVNGVYEGSSREILKTVAKTSYNEVLGNSDKGERNTTYELYDYVDGSYVKNEDASSNTTDDTYRYSITSYFIAQFEVDNLVKTFKEDDDLNDTLLVGLNKLMKNYFIEFESFMDDASIGEEIIKYAQNYQYRAKIDDQTIYQYTFFDDSGTHDTLSSISIFNVNKNGQMDIVYFLTVIY